jgi:hypothetical protein
MLIAPKQNALSKVVSIDKLRSKELENLRSFMIFELDHLNDRIIRLKRFVDSLEV